MEENLLNIDIEEISNMPFGITEEELVEQEELGDSKWYLLKQLT